MCRWLLQNPQLIHFNAKAKWPVFIFENLWLVNMIALLKNEWELHLLVTSFYLWLNVVPSEKIGWKNKYKKYLSLHSQHVETCDWVNSTICVAHSELLGKLSLTEVSWCVKVWLLQCYFMRLENHYFRLTLQPATTPSPPAQTMVSFTWEPHQSGWLQVG